ncbi:argininosuccinate lyase [Trifolium repens]|nr:argininosuccinate lyase [Trifolium repens]
MSQEQCIKALSEHAGIKPLVTLTVWRELQKENEEFFRAYLQQNIPPRPFMSNRFQRGEGLSRKKYWK